MSYQKSELYFLSTLLAGVCILAYFILAPFLNALILAVIFSTIFAPVHKRIFALTREQSGFSALFATTLVLIVIVVPVTFLSAQILKEATALYSSLINSNGTSSISQGLAEAVRNLGIPSLPSESLNLSQYMKQGLSLLIQNLGVVFSNIAKIMVGIFVFLIALYYLFKDGGKLKKIVVAQSPLQDIYDETIFRKLELAINGVVRGSILVGLAHGVLASMGLTIFGVPNPVLWGSVVAIAALVPGFGTALVMVPSILFLFFTGATTFAGGLFVWWVISVGLVDNVLAPRFVGKGMKLHPFLILLSILGGIGLFGPFGFLFGPLVLSLLFVFLEIYSAVRKERNS